MRRYTFKLYPSKEQAAALHEQRMMVADIWNALLEMIETIRRRTIQRTVWIDSSGRRHVGISIHAPSWLARIDDGTPVYRPAGVMPTEFDLGYWISEMLAQCPEWRALSTWTPRR